MKCMKCGKEAFKSTTTEAIELGFGVLVVRNIVYTEKGSYYLAD